MFDPGKHRCLALLLLTSLSLAAGCKQAVSNQKNISTVSDQNGYLHSDGINVMFLHWTELDGKLNGQMNVFYAKGGQRISTETSSHSFEGVSDGNNISLNFTGSQWTDGLGGRTWTGTISRG